MATTTIRVSHQTHAALREMACETGLTMLEVLERAVSSYHRQQQLEAINAAYASLRENPMAWHEAHEENAMWDTTLTDGLVE